MPKKSANAKASENWQKTFDLPKELDFSKLRVVGVGLEALRSHAAKKKKTVELDPDIAKDFPTSEAVNNGLRVLREIQNMIQPHKRRKTA